MQERGRVAVTGSAGNHRRRCLEEFTRRQFPAVLREAFLVFKPGQRITRYNSTRRVLIRPQSRQSTGGHAYSQEARERGGGCP